MAVVTLKYIKNKQHVRAHLRYITHRKGEKSKGKTTRTLFANDGITDKKAFYEIIDRARRGALFYKIMISPDPSREDTYKDLDLPHITRRTIQKLEGQLGRRLLFVAAVHDDHTNKRHVHGIFLLGKRLPKEQFKALAITARRAATQEARLQRKARDRVREHPRYRTLTGAFAAARVSPSLPTDRHPPNETLRGRPREALWQAEGVSRGAFPKAQGRGGGVNAPVMQPACSSCGYGDLSGIPRYLRYCLNCHMRLTKDRARGQTAEVGR